MSKWEYKNIVFSGNEYIASTTQEEVTNEKTKVITYTYKDEWKPLNELGLDRWEMVGFQPDKKHSEYFIAVFKREIEPEIDVTSGNAREVEGLFVKHGARLNLDTNIKIDASSYR